MYNIRSNSKNDFQIVSRYQDGISLHGDIISSDCTFFNGRLKGNLNIDNNLILGKKAEVEGNIAANSIISWGKITGDVKVREFSFFLETSFFKGQLSTKILEVKEGAFFHAKCNHDHCGNEVLEENNKDYRKIIDSTQYNSKDFYTQIFQEKENKFIL